MTINDIQELLPVDVDIGKIHGTKNGKCSALGDMMGASTQGDGAEGSWC